MGSADSSSQHALAAEDCFPEERGVDAEQTKTLSLYIYIPLVFLFVLVNIHSFYVERLMAF